MPNPSQHAAFRPIAVTLIALVAYRLGAQLPLPGLDLDYLSQIGTGGAVSPEALGRLSVLALGVLPWFSALTLAELFAVVLPQSGIERFTTSGHVQPFSRPVIVLTVLVAAFQGLGIARAMSQIPNLVAEPGPAFVISAVATLVAGTAILIALALIIERHGMGHGFWIMLAASMLAQMPSHFRVMLMMLEEGLASPAATAVAVASTAAIVALVVALLEARRRANVTSLGIFVWPLVLASLASGLIVGIASLTLPEGSDGQIDSLAKMLTNEPAGFVIGGVIGGIFVAGYADREQNWQFFLPAAALVIAVQLQSIMAEHLQVQPPLAGASLVIVAVVLYLVVMRVREMMQGT